VQGGLAHAVTARTARTPLDAHPGTTRPPVFAATSAPAPRHAHPERLAPILLGAMVGALVAGRLETGALCLLVATFVAARAGARPPSRAWLGLLASGAVLSITLNLYLNPGEPLPLPVFLGRHATREGLRNGVLLVMRVTGATFAVQGLAALWPGERAADEIAGLLAPLELLRVPVRKARAMLSLALRFAPLVTDEFRRVAQVQALRAGRPPRGGREWVQRQRAAIVPAVVGSLERADRVALALEARHYRLRPVSRGPRSPWWVSATGVALAVVALAWRA
jgi:energy-coupling factor transporter transmembrane protein EcfT